jgi:hypothetical protein
VELARSDSETMYAVRCMLYDVCCTMYAVRCMLYDVRCMLYDVCCTMYALRCRLYERKLLEFCLVQSSEIYVKVCLKIFDILPLQCGSITSLVNFTVNMNEIFQIQLCTAVIHKYHRHRPGTDLAYFKRKLTGPTSKCSTL